MTNTFTGLFDTKKHGFNVLAALAYFAGGLIGWLLWGVWGVLELLIRYGQFHFPFSLENLAYGVEISVIGAVAVVGLAHVLNNDILLPIVSGLAMVLWGLLARSVGILPPGPTLEVGRLAMDFFGTLLPVTGVIVFYRSLGNRPLAFVLGFASGELLAQMLATVVFHLPMKILFEGLVIKTGSGALTGLLFFAAMASHLGWRKATVLAPPGEEHPTRSTGLVLLGCLVSLFVPGLGHLVLGYLKEGIRILGAAVGAFALAFLAALVVPKQVAILPLFVVWLFALRDLWGRRSGAGQN